MIPADTNGSQSTLYVSDCRRVWVGWAVSNPTINERSFGRLRTGSSARSGPLFDPFDELRAGYGATGVPSVNCTGFVFRGWLGVVNDQHLNRAYGGRELEADSTHGIEDRIGDLAARRVAWPAYEVKRAGQSGLIDYGPLENTADAGGEFVHGDTLSSDARGTVD